MLAPSYPSLAHSAVQPTVQSAVQSAAVPTAADSAKLGWILIRNRWISASQLQAALLRQTQLPQAKLGELLLQQALISETQLQQALQEQYWRRNGYWVI